MNLRHIYFVFLHRSKIFVNCDVIILFVEDDEILGQNRRVACELVLVDRIDDMYLFALEMNLSSI